MSDAGSKVPPTMHPKTSVGSTGPVTRMKGGDKTGSPVLRVTLVSLADAPISPR